MSANIVLINGKIPHFEANYKAGEGEKTSFMNYAISVKRDRKPADAQYYPEDLISIKAFGGTADFINNYFKAGDGIILQGRIQRDDDYEKDGQTVKGQLYVLVEKAMFPDGKASGNDGEAAPKAAAAKPAGKPPVGAPGAKKPGVPPGKKPGRPF